MSEFVKGWIVTPAKGYAVEIQKELAFPVGIPVKIIGVVGDQVTVVEPHGKTITFKRDDISQEPDSCNWQEEWDRHENPERHRWNLVEAIEKRGSQVFIDWECGPYPIKSYKEFFKKVFSACKVHFKDDDPDFNNMLMDLTLLILGESDDIDSYTQDQIDLVAYTIGQLITCKTYVKSGKDWTNMSEEEFFNSMEDE
jgi:hypothetical protein